MHTWTLSQLNKHIPQITGCCGWLCCGCSLPRSHMPAQRSAPAYRGMPCKPTCAQIYCSNRISQLQRTHPIIARDTHARAALSPPALAPRQLPRKRQHVQRRQRARRTRPDINARPRRPHARRRSSSLERLCARSPTAHRLLVAHVVLLQYAHEVEAEHGQVGLGQRAWGEQRGWLRRHTLLRARGATHAPGPYSGSSNSGRGRGMRGGR